VDNQETLVTLSTQDTGRRLTKHKNTTQQRKLNRRATRIPPKTGGEPHVFREG